MAITYVQILGDHEAIVYVSSTPAHYVFLVSPAEEHTGTVATITSSGGAQSISLPGGYFLGGHEYDFVLLDTDDNSTVGQFRQSYDDGSGAGAGGSEEDGLSHVGNPANMPWNAPPYYAPVWERVLLNTRELTGQGSAQLGLTLDSLDQLKATPERGDNDLVLKDLDGSLARDTSYLAPELSLTFRLNGNVNPDGSVNTTMHPGVVLDDLRDQLDRALAGNFTLETQRLDSSRWANTGRKLAATAYKSLTKNDGGQRAYIEELSFTVRLNDPMWRCLARANGDSGDVDFTVSDTGGGAYRPPELDNMLGSIDDAVLTLNGTDVRVLDRANGTYVAYQGAANNVVIRCSRFQNGSLLTNGFIAQHSSGRGHGGMKLGSVEKDCTLEVSGGSVRIQATRKSIRGL